MTWKRLRFCLICILLWPLSIFVADEMHRYLAPAIRWLGLSTGATALSRGNPLNIWLPLTFVEGFLLGLIPIQTVRRLIAESLARFRHGLETKPGKEWDLARPILWAWALPTFCFAIRFITCGPHTSHSVLGDTEVSSGPGRLAYFFSPPNDYISSWTPSSG
jgi:hypothetical protein